MGERLVPFGQQLLPIAAGARRSVRGLKAVFQIVAERAQERFIGLGMKPPQYLKVGDVVELGIEGLGESRQQVVNYS